MRPHNLREGEDGGMGTRFPSTALKRKEVMVRNEARERNNSNFVSCPRTSQHKKIIKRLNLKNNNNNNNSLRYPTNTAALEREPRWPPGRSPPGPLPGLPGGSQASGTGQAGAPPWDVPGQQRDRGSAPPRDEQHPRAPRPHPPRPHLPAPPSPALRGGALTP